MKILKRIQNLISTKSPNTENLHIPQTRLNSSIQTGFLPASEKTELPAIIICLDVSPSMDFRDFEPSRLAAVKVAARQFADNIQMTAPTTEIGIIGFSRDAQIALPLSSTRTDLSLIKSSIEGLTTSPSTNLCAPLELAMNMLLAPYKNYTSRRVLLLTDGDHNCSGDPRQHAIYLKSQDIQLDIIGIGSGGSFDENILREMASVKNRELRYWFINSTEGLIQRFQTLALRNG